MIGRAALFVPVDSPSMINNCVVFDADSLIFDLEDSVLIDEKDAARILLREALETLDFLRDKNVLVRINAPSTQFWKHDLMELIQSEVRGLIIPKATTAGIEAVDREITKLEKRYAVQHRISLVPIVETALALETVDQILNSSKRNIGILFGAEDYAADMGIQRTKEGEEISYARSKLANAAHAFGLEAIDTPFTDMQDTEGLRKDAARAKMLGMTGKTAIHPKQIDHIRSVFTPTQEEISQAFNVVRVARKNRERGVGTFSLDGRMIDPAVIARSRFVLKLIGAEEGSSK